MRLHSASSSQAGTPPPLVSLSPCLGFSPPRRGVILLVVLVMLTLFAMVAITFVYFSDQQATQAGYFKESEVKSRPAPDLLSSYALNQWVFDTANNASSMQTHGMLSGMYGTSGITPFSSLGRNHGSTGDPITVATGLDKHDLINYFGRVYSEAGPYNHGALSAPYTYPDNNSAWLGAMDASGVIPARLARHTNYWTVGVDMMGNPVLAPFTTTSTYFARSFTRNVKLPIIREITLASGETFTDLGYIWFDPYAPANVWFWNRDLYWVPGSPFPYTPQPPAVFVAGMNAYLATKVPPPLDPVFDSPPAGATVAYAYRPGFLAVMAVIATRNEVLRASVTRPGPWDHPDLVLPDDVGGDVKNLPPGSSIGGSTPWYGNESYWQHIGFPIQVGADGRRYVPLFGFFSTDLDGKVNVNAAGGIWGASSAHVSHQGLGAWEVNASRLLTYGPPIIAATPNGPTEGIRLFQGNSTSYPLLGGKYGVGVTAGVTASPLFYPLWSYKVPFYSLYDGDGARELAGYTQSDPFRLPGYDVAAGDTWNYDRQPRFVRRAVPNTVWGYGSGSAGETSQLVSYHPMGYGYFSQLPGSANRTFPVSDVEALLRHGDTGADSLNSDIRHLLTNNMLNTRLRRLLTTHSADIERPGVLPYWHGATAYTIPAAPPGEPQEMPPAGAAIATPAGSGVGGEFTADWRALSAALRRLDLNRPLAEYPLPGAEPGGADFGRIRTQDMGSFLAAQTSRQALATDIHARFTATTGATDADALRYLAQLAVNIVDYIDNDDYNTPFNYSGALYVYGTELPRLVINEAYAEYDDAGMPPNVTVNVWVELYNPLGASSTTGDPILAKDPDPNAPVGPPVTYWPGGTAKLWMRDDPVDPMGKPKYGIYRVVIARSSAVDTANANHLRALNNVAGVVAAGDTHQRPGGAGPCEFSTWEDPDLTMYPETEFIRPSGNNFSGILDDGPAAGGQDFSRAPELGFYLLGPLPSIPAGGSPSPPVPQTTRVAPEMSYTIPTANAPTLRPTIVLQRLACPHLPFNAATNPYITVDYLSNLRVNQAAAGNEMTRYSQGKRQPYTSRRDVTGAPYPPAPFIWANIADQNPDPSPPGKPPRAEQPRHTFLRHNSVEEINYDPMVVPPPLTPLGIDYNDDGTNEAPDPNGLTGPPPQQQLLRLPYEWLKHLDRTLTSPMEILQASAYKPHELTQQFMVDRPKAAVPRDHLIDPLGSVDATTGLVNEEAFQHIIRWFDPSAPATSNRLYRALEFLRTRNRAVGTSQVTLGVMAIAPVDPVNSPFLYRVQVPALSWASVGSLRGDNGGLWAITVGSSVVINGGTAVRVAAVSNVPGTYTFDAYFPPSEFQQLIWPVPNPAAVPNPAVAAVTVTYLDGRQPGQINLNTLLDLEVFRALCDAQPANTFNTPLPVPTTGPLAWIGSPVFAATAAPLGLPAGSGVFTAGPPNILKGAIHGVDWLLREGDPAGLPTYRGTFLEFNDAVAGRETVEVISIIDASGLGNGPFAIHYIAVDHNLNRLSQPINTRQLHHTRTAAGNPFPIAVDNVATMFTRILAARDVAGRPFMGYSAGLVAGGDTQYSGGLSIADTLLRSDPVDAAKKLYEAPVSVGPPALPVGPPPVTQPLAVHPERAYELLCKIHNNTTVRSNVFAVWMTVGYFEVDALNRIGREIGRADGRQVRHRMFAIIDRTNAESYVQAMNAYLQAATNGEISYDVRLGATPPSTANYVPTALNNVIPIVANNLLDPRRIYTSVVQYQRITAPIPPGPPPIYTVDLPPAVLYWSIIE